MSTGALREGTGTPPAIRFEDLEEWRKLADNIDAALKMGGEQGMDLLLGVMTDWCRVVDELNAAYQICCDLAGKGLRDEAIHWHAEGFFEVADRLDPDRPGWELWEQTLTAQGVIIPSLDGDLKMLTNQIFDELKAVHINGQVLEQEVKSLRRNMLFRGDLSERITILNRLQEVDATSPNWREMLRPYRKKRAGEVLAGVDELLSQEDVRGLCRLNAEIERQNWDDEISAEARATLLSAVGWQSAENYLQKLRHELTELCVGCREAQSAEYGSPRFQSGLNKARTQRSRYLDSFENLKAAITEAEGCPRVRRIVRERAFLDHAKSLEAAARNEAEWLGEQDKYDVVVQRFDEVEQAITKLLVKTPQYRFGEGDAYLKASKKWLQKTEELLTYGRRLCKQAPMIPKHSEELITRLVEREQSVKVKRESVRNFGKVAALSFIAIMVTITVVGVIIGFLIG